MAVLGKEYQPVVKDSGSVLVGVAQVRVGKSSIRPAGTAVVGVAQAVGKSTAAVDATDGATTVVTPTDNPNGGTAVISTPATAYSGIYDGCFIIRITSTGPTGGVDVFSPNGYKNSTTLTSGAMTAFAPKMNSVDPSGVTITAAFTDHAVGDTWVIPVWAGSAVNRVQTCIVSPYSMFRGSAESVGGLKAASFQPKLDSIKTLESGFPEEVMDRIVTKTSAEVKFDSLEYTNANIKILRDAVSMIINQATLPAMPLEVVMRTRGNSLVSFWIPNAGIESAPTYAPTNDYSTLSWTLSAVSQSEIQAAGDFAAVTAAEIGVFNAWARNISIFNELSYTH